MARRDLLLLLLWALAWSESREAGEEQGKKRLGEVV
jgi:hypothetical protein